MNCCARCAINGRGSRIERARIPRRTQLGKTMVTPVSTNQIWRFGVYEVDTRRVELRHDGVPVKMREQSLLILVYLLEHAGETVSREELRQVLWPSDTFVDYYHSLNTAVMNIRDALGDSTEAPLYIETIPKRGYRFIAPLARVEHQFAYSLEFPEAMSGHLASTDAEQIGKGKEIVGAVSVAEATAADRLPPQKGSEAESKRLWKIVAPSVVLLLVVLIAVGFFYRWRQTRVLTNKDTIVLSDFDNKTGDSVFDDTLKQGLSVQLEQSPFLDLVSERKVNETLKLMGRPAGDRLTPEVTREVCQRTGSKAMLTGSIAGLGSQYVIGLKAVNCNTGDVLAEAQEQAAGKEAVLKALDAAAVSLREQAGRVAQLGAEIRHAGGGSDHAIAGGAESLQPGTKDGLCERGHSRAALLQTGGGTRPEFCHGLRLDVGCLQRPQRSRAGGRECTQGLRAAGEGERTGAVLHRGELLLDRDGRAGEGGADLRAVAADLPKRRLALQ